MKFFPEGLILFYILSQHSEISESAELPTPKLGLFHNTDSSSWPKYVLSANGIAATMTTCFLTNNTHQPSCRLIMLKDNETMGSMSCTQPWAGEYYKLYGSYSGVGMEYDNGKQIYCKAIYPSGNRTSKQRYTIRIATPPKKPEISGPETVVWETTFAWTCDVKGGSHEAPDVRWKFGNNTEIADNLYSNTVNEYKTKYGIKKYNVSSTLQLYVPKDQQNFNLTCRYIHNVSKAALYNRKPEKTASVTVLGMAMKIACTPGPLKVNDTLSCSCSVSGLEEQPQLSWPGHSDGAQFNISSVTLEDNGLRFVCNMKFKRFTFNSTEYILTVTEENKSTDKEVPTDNKGTTDNNVTADANPEESSDSLVTIIIVLVALVLVLGSVYMYYKYKNKSANQSAPSNPKMTDSSVPSPKMIDSHMPSAPGESEQAEQTEQVPSQKAASKTTSETTPEDPSKADPSEATPI